MLKRPEGEQMKQFKALYSDIQVIKGYNTKLYRDLEPRILEWTPYQSFGDIFLQVVCLINFIYLSFPYFVFVMYLFKTTNNNNKNKLTNKNNRRCS